MQRTVYTHIYIDICVYIYIYIYTYIHVEIWCIYTIIMIDPILRLAPSCVSFYPAP